MICAYLIGGTNLRNWGKVRGSSRARVISVSEKAVGYNGCDAEGSEYRVRRCHNKERHNKERHWPVPVRARPPLLQAYAESSMTQGAYTLFTTLAPEPNDSGPINSLLFIRNATLLVSGGDDQILRIWDVYTNKCVQKLHSPRWGQITALSWLKLSATSEANAVLFIGTGRGVVSAYPFSDKSNQLSTTTAVFRLDDSVEVQALDLLRSRFAVASHSGQIRMFGLKDSKFLVPLWNIQVQDIPRGIFFDGTDNERLTVHTCCLGDVYSINSSSTYDDFADSGVCSIYCNSESGKLIGRTRLAGGVGSATLSENQHIKATYNLSTGNFDIYEPPDSLAPISLMVPTTSRLIKQCVFTEDGRTVVCGGDDGTVNVFRLGERPEMQSLSVEGPDTFYAITTMSTFYYHFIACGDSEEPATIFIWRKPTEMKVMEDRELQLRLAREESTSMHVSAETEIQDLKEKLKALTIIYEYETQRQKSGQSTERYLLAAAVVTLSVLFPTIGLCQYCENPYEIKLPDSFLLYNKGPPECEAP
ncbi:WD40-repeat-containing domain protein [Mycena metata]|uniref:WD40-repeat-containing domain protein n=1 Tax=Mycena metata TaxID=1033252 RepID=A0AAD7MF33_9AGAR|nr:WD40-repeat-containing domain protein [Mycena metata]